MKNLKTKKTTIAAKVTAIISAAKCGNRKVHNSFIELLRTGSTQTGSSGYSKGWSHKSIWTADVRSLARSMGLRIESGNNAPRGGASGEYVALVADRRYNRIIHAYNAIIARGLKIKAVRDLRKWEAIRLKRDTEYNLLLPFVGPYISEIFDAQKLSGQKKQQLQNEIMRLIIADSGVERIVNYWDVWKLLSAYGRAQCEITALAEVQARIDSAIASGKPIITKERFCNLTHACLFGVNNFLKQIYGTDKINMLPLSEVLTIAPASYVNYL